MNYHARFMSQLAVACVTLGWAATAVAAEPVDLSGKWHGSWESCKTGHHGKLSATFHKINETCYQVRFSGTFFVALPFTFRVNLQAADQGDGRLVLFGSPRLPFFGTFSLSASADDHDFSATYSSRNDEGRFVLTR
jgi:hypothetical protein